MATGEAKTKIVIDVGEGAKSLRTLKQEFKETQKELDNTIVGTKEYTAAIKKLANVKDEIEDLNKEITAFRPDQKLAAFVGVGRGLAAGFEAATAGAALFGGEAKEVEKAMLKVQAAMAMANAIQELGELGKSFKLLSGIIKAAFASNPFGVILIAITAVVAAIAAFTNGTKDAEEANESFKKSLEGTNKEFDRLNNVITFAAEKEKLWVKIKGGSEEEINKIEKESLKKQIDLSEKKFSKYNKDVWELTKKYGSEAEVTKAAYAESQKAQDDLLKKKEAFELFNLQSAANANEKNRAEFAKNEAQEKQDAADRRKISDAKKIAAEKESWDNINAIAEQAAKENADELEKENKKILADKKREKEGEAFVEEESNRIAAEMQATNDANDLKNAQDLAAKKAAIQQAEISVAASAMSALGSIGQIAINDGQKLAKYQKALALTQIAIDTAKAISSVIAAATANPTNAVDFGVTAVVQTASGIAMVLANIAKAKQILESGNAPASISLGGGGGSSGSPSRPPNLNQVGNTSTNLANIMGGSGQRTAAPIKAYVVETDSTEAQKRIARIEYKTKF